MGRGRRGCGPQGSVEGAGGGGMRGGSRAGPRRVPLPEFLLGAAQAKVRGARAAPTWAFCRALRRSSCTKGFRPGGASRRASPAPALEAGASRGPRPRILMAAPPSARGAEEPGGPGASGTRSGAEHRASAGRGCAAPGAGRCAAAQAREGRRRDVGGGRRRGRVRGVASPQTPPTSGPERQPDPAPSHRPEALWGCGLRGCWAGLRGSEERWPDLRDVRAAWSREKRRTVRPHVRRGPPHRAFRRSAHGRGRGRGS